MTIADELVAAILAADAQRRHKLHSERTKAALAWAKARGVKLGGPNLAAIRGKGAATNRRMAAERDAKVLPVIRSLQRDKPFMSLRQIARELNKRGVPTARGLQWSAVTVSKVLARAEERHFARLERHDPARSNPPTRRRR